ncbi:MAG: translation elongation factor Ts, partial [Bacteroidota bacterium]|nr:translation elongation factor Ts [Bacteroidota bacterium]
MAVTMAEISKLRTMTGAGMMDCKKALIEANNDMEMAIEIIRKKGQAVAAKRSDREASEGCVLAGQNGEFAAALALKCETDFVATNADFVKLTQSILDLALTMKPASLDELKSLKLGDRTVEEKVTERSGITGEKMELDFYEFVTGPSTVFYIHQGNKLATVVSFNKAVDHQVAREIAMQAAAMNPISLDRDSVPAHVIETELEIGRDKAREEGKPENML